MRREDNGVIFMEKCWSIYRINLGMFPLCYRWNSDQGQNGNFKINSKLIYFGSK